MRTASPLANPPAPPEYPGTTMIQTIDLTRRARTTAELLAAVPRATAAAAEAGEASARIID